MRPFKGDNGQAGSLYGKKTENVEFQLTSAEIHLNIYYNNLNKTNANKDDKESSKILPL